MSNEQKREATGTHEGHGSHRVLWTIVVLFIILAIWGMWAIDYYYSPEMINSTTLPDAVGK